jgi:tetratricopeptide (TPR) repeat protein
MLGQDRRAIKYFERGLEYCDDPAERSEIFQLIAEVQTDQSNFTGASVMALQAQHALEPIRNNKNIEYRNQMAGINNVKSWIYRLKGDTVRALRTAKKGFGILPARSRDRKTLEEKSKLLNTIAGAYYLLGDPQCLRYYRLAIRIEKRLGQIRAVATLKNNLGNAYSGFGNSRKGIALTREFLKLSERIGDRDGIATAAESLGCQHYTLDDHQRAIEYLLRSYRVSKEIGSDYGVSYTSNNLGIVYFGIGETKKALEFFRQDLRIARRDRVLRNKARALYNIGSVYLRTRDYAMARRFLESSVRILERIKDRVRLQNCLHRLAVALASEKSGRRKAFAMLKRSLRLARRTPPRSEVAAAHANYGKVLAFMADAAGIRRHFEKALEIYHQDGLRRLEADTCLDYAQALINLPKDQRPEPKFIKKLLLRAREIYSKLRIEKKRLEVEKLLG